MITTPFVEQLWQFCWKGGKFLICQLLEVGELMEANCYQQWWLSGYSSVEYDV